MKKIKILYIVSNIKRESGVSTVIMNYYRKLNKNLLQIDFLLVKKYNDSYENELKENGSNVYYLSNEICPKNVGKVKKEIKAFFANNYYDIVELHSPTFSFLFLKEAKKSNIKTRIVHTHSTVRSPNKIKNLISGILNKNMAKYANVYFACSEKSGQYWFPKKIREGEKYFLIKNAIDASKFEFNKENRENIRKELNINNEEMVAGFVGRLSNEKNVDFLRKVMIKVLKINSKIRFLIVGEGPKMKKMRKHTRKYEKNIVFLGRRNDVNKILSGLDLMLLPSKREGLPMALIEAQLTGIKCLASDTITEEANIGGVKFLKLNKNVWVNEIIGNNFENNIKVNRGEFDIETCSNELEKIYIRVSSC